MLSRFITRSGLSTARRFISTSHLLFNSPKPQAVSKEALQTLRKKTGYSFANCRKALVQFGESNLLDAENWLRETARKEGWNKAAKLSGRQASQGLVAVSTNNNVGALLELNCETDFVGRSADFKNLVEEIVDAILEYGKNFADSKAPKDKNEFVSISLDDSVMTKKGRSVKEAIALSVGQMRENITITRAEAIISNPQVKIQANTHPNLGSESIKMGQFASIIGMLREESDSKFPTEKLCHQICQHIIGMRPESLGTPGTSEKTRLDLLDEKEFEAEKESDDLNDFADVQSTQIDENETQLLRQSFMLQPSMTIHEYLNTHSAQLLWFLRLELGETPKDKS